VCIFKGTRAINQSLSFLISSFVNVNIVFNLLFFVLNLFSKHKLIISLSGLLICIELLGSLELGLEVSSLLSVLESSGEFVKNT
jgi:hypothetical protein